MTSLVGQSIDRYHILEQLGEGGMAVVYKAYDTRLERDVAIKVILPSYEHTDKFLKRFEREARALAKLSHPNIVGVIDYGQYNNLPYLVMEYLPGGTLKEKVHQSMPWQEAAWLLAPIARALAFAHQQGILHRDIKPSNILITQSGEPMLSDFGLAKILEAQDSADLTGSTGVVGTPAYMAPEQITGNAVDRRADIYALGIVFYELVTGRTPYRADTPAAVMIKAATEPMPRPTEFISYLPDHVERVILKALDRNPDNRYQTMDELAQVLERLAADRQTAPVTMAPTIIAAPPPIPVTPAPKTPTQLAPVTPPPPLPAQPTGAGQRSTQPEMPVYRPMAEAPKKKSNKLGWLIGCGIPVLVLVLIGIVGAIAYVLTGGFKNFTFGTVPSAPTATLWPPTKIPTSTPIPIPTVIPIYVEPYQPQDGDNYETLRTLAPGWEGVSVPSVLVWDVSVASNQPVLIFHGWCTTTQAILDQNFQHLQYLIEIDGRLLNMSDLYVEEGQNSERACKTYVGLIRSWPEGTHVIRTTMRLDAAINDGWGDYPAGDYVDVFNITVLPPTSSGMYLFEDDFSDPNSGWLTSNNGGDKMGYLDGTFQISLTSTMTDLVTQAGQSLPADVIIEVEATNTGSTDNNDFGIICRVQDLDNFYFFEVASDGYAVIGRFLDNKMAYLSGESMMSVDGIYAGSTPNHIRAECIGNMLRLYANGNLVAETTDSTFTTGGDVGLIAGSFDVGGIDIRFDNFVVIKP